MKFFHAVSMKKFVMSHEWVLDSVEWKELKREVSNINKKSNPFGRTCAVARKGGGL
ncbi:MAG: hypothetical protein GY696_33970 [Gammaproteobacteria bacterium]|nr:hypothetical protein [Gammaproteobacteria bacterium]